MSTSLIFSTKLLIERFEFMRDARVESPWFSSGVSDSCWVEMPKNARIFYDVKTHLAPQLAAGFLAEIYKSTFCFLQLVSNLEKFPFQNNFFEDAKKKLVKVFRDIRFSAIFCAITMGWIVYIWAWNNSSLVEKVFMLRHRRVCS